MFIQFCIVQHAQSWGRPLNENSNGPPWAQDGLDIRAPITNLASPSKRMDLHPWFAEMEAKSKTALSFGLNRGRCKNLFNASFILGTQMKSSNGVDGIWIFWMWMAVLVSKKKKMQRSHCSIAMKQGGWGLPNG